MRMLPNVPSSANSSRTGAGKRQIRRGRGGSDGSLPAPELPPAPPEPVSRACNEQVLGAIRNDFARATVHARNLLHASAATYDAPAAYQDVSAPYLPGRAVEAFRCELGAFRRPNDIAGARAQAISHAVCRLIRYRFAAAPGTVDILSAADAKMQE